MISRGIEVTSLPQIHLTLNDPCISESCIETKIKLNFYFHFFVVPHKVLWRLFYEGFMAFIKPFEVPQKSVKIEI